MSEDSKYLSNFSPLNGSIPVGMTPFTESLKNTYERVTKYFDEEIKKKLENKNVLISAHGNSIRALCKKMFNIDDNQISNLEIPTGNPLIVELNKNSKIVKCEYLDKDRAKDLIVFWKFLNLLND